MRYQQSQEYQPHHDFSDQVSWVNMLSTPPHYLPLTPTVLTAHTTLAILAISNHHLSPPSPRAVPSSASSRYCSTSRRQRRAGILPSPRPTMGVVFGSSHRRARVCCSIRCGPTATVMIYRCTRVSQYGRASSGSATSGCGIPSAESIWKGPGGARAVLLALMISLALVLICAGASTADLDGTQSQSI